MAAILKIVVAAYLNGQLSPSDRIFMTYVKNSHLVMSTEDFQTKYACFMDGLVKSTVAETTKLFETVVDELKAELSKVKTENEALKTTCRQIANAKIIAIKEPGQNGCSNIQDTAVQCDILPYHLLMVDQPVVQSGEEQVKQCKEEQMLYIVLNNHDGVAEKEENPNMTVSVPNHEDSEPTVASQNILCTFPDPPPTTACENEIRDPEIGQQCLTEELRKRQDTQVTSLDGGHNLPEAPNQSIQPVNDVISLAGINDIEAGQISAQSSETSEVRTELPSLGDVLNVESTLWNKQLGERAKYILAKVKTEWETGAQNDTERNIRTPKIVNSFAQAPSPALIMCSGSATVQDAMLLLDAMGHSKNRSTPQEVATPRDCCLDPNLASVVSSPLPSPPTADVSSNGVEEVTTDETLFDARPTQSDNFQFDIGVSSEHQQQDGVASSDMASTPLPTSNSLRATVVPDPAPLQVKSPSPHPQETTAPLSPNQISVSKVKPAPNKRSRVASSSFGLFRRKRKVNSRTSAPRLTSDKTIGSTQQRSNPTVFKKVKIIIRRAPDVEASPPPLPETLNQDAIGPAVPMTSSEEPNAVAQVTSDQSQSLFEQAEPSSPQTNICDSFQIGPGEQPATESVAITGSLSPPRRESEQMNISEEKAPEEQAESSSSPTPPTSPQMEPSSEPASFCQNLTPEEQAAASSSEDVPRNSRPLVPLIKLKRLPRLSAGSVLIPQSLTDDSESGDVPAGDSSSSLLDDQALQTTTRPSQVSTSPCPDLNDSSTIPEELCGPHFPLTQIQLLAQVCLVPVIQDAEKASPNKSAHPQNLSDARGEKKLGKESNIIHPRTTRNTYSQTKRTKTEPEPQTGKPPIPKIAKKAKLETIQDPTPKPVPVPTKRAVSSSPTGPPKENTFSRPSLRNQRKSTTNAQSKTVSVRTRNPVVRLCRLSLKETLFVVPSPHTAANVRVRSRKDSTAKNSKNRLSRTKIAHEKNINLPRHQPTDKIKKEKTKNTSEQKFQLHPTGMKNAPSEPLWIYKAPEELIAKQESDSLEAKSGSSSVQSPKSANGSVVKTREKSGSNQKSTVEEKTNVQDTKNSVIKTESNSKPIIHQPAGNKWPSPIVRVGETPQPLRFIISKKNLLKNQCRYCGRILCDSTSLNSHIKLHTGHRPFCCKLCPKNFPNGRGLKRHMKVHRKGRNHVCKQCGKGFVYKFDLTKHVQMVHGKMKPFICQLCSKAFFTKRDVETHIRGHNGEKPYHCHLCEKRFLRSTELSAHLRWHRGEKRHWCPYCGKGFFDQTNLKRHKYIHTGEKPHSCPHCPKQFTQSGHLKKHVKNVHKVQ